MHPVAPQRRRLVLALVYGMSIAFAACAANHQPGSEGAGGSQVRESEGGTGTLAGGTSGAVIGGAGPTAGGTTAGSSGEAAGASSGGASAVAGAGTSGTAAGGSSVSTEPSSLERIQDARIAGTLDEKMAAFYQLLAQFSPERLPPEYQASVPLGGPADVSAMGVARTHLAEYAPSQLAAVTAMLTDPEDPNWLVFPPDMPTHNLAPGANNCRSLFSAEAGGGRFVGRAITTVHFVFRPLLPTTSDVPAQEAIVTRLTNALATTVPDVGGGGAVSFGDYLDHVYDYYRNDLGMKEPSSLKKPAANAGRIPVYVATCDGHLNDAFAEPNDAFIFTSVQLAFEEPVLRRVVLPHEIFHAFEAAYKVPEPNADFAWPNEACAVAVEDLVAPSVRRYSGAFASNPSLQVGTGLPMDRSFKCPEEPFHSSYEGPCRNRAAGDKRYNGSYSKFALIKFLMRNHGLLMGPFWEKFAAAGGNPTSLITPDQLAAFAVSLVGDVQGKTPFFSPEERAAFCTVSVSAPGVDLITGDNERYTFRLDPAAVTSSKSYRFTPDQSMSIAKTLARPDAAASPIAPGGTHRLLLEIPEAVRALRDAKLAGPPIQIAFELTGCSQCAVSVAAVAPDGAAPSRLLDTTPSGDNIPTPVAAQSRWKYEVADDMSLPQFIVAIVSNLGGAAMTYKAGFTLVEACEKKCADYYENDRRDQRCDEYMCQSLKDAVAPQYDECIANHQDSRADAGVWCLTVCNTYLTGSPYPVKHNDCPSVEWQKDICSNGGVADCSAMPAEFVPIPDWPKVPCYESIVTTLDYEPACTW